MKQVCCLMEEVCPRCGSVMSNDDICFEGMSAADEERFAEGLCMPFYCPGCRTVQMVGR